MNTIQATALEHDEVFVAELHRLGVRHLARLANIENTVQLPTPEELIVGLAGSQNARLQAALILLFLRQPTYSQYIPNTFDQLPIDLAEELKLYYQAAVYLQVELQSILQTNIPGWKPLPDLFSRQLELPLPGSANTENALQLLGERHRQLSGWNFNWAASYRQNIPRFLKHIQNAE